MCLAACGGKDDVDAKPALVGTWAANKAEGASYNFNEDGTGKWNMSDGLEMNFTYVDTGTLLTYTRQ